MQMLYNSDSYAVVQFEVPPVLSDGLPSADLHLQAPPTPEAPDHPVPLLTRGGYEIVDKMARREIFIEGAMAERFEAGVKRLIDSSPSEEDVDAFLETYASMAQQAVTLH